MTVVRPADTREIELAVEGMTCAACAARVEKKLGRLGGVRAAVNYATGTALPLAALGFLNPVIAAVAMTLSSAFVVANSLRLQRQRIDAGTPRDGRAA